MIVLTASIHCHNIALYKYTDVLSPMITVSSVTATSATLSFSQPTNSLSVDMYTVTLTGTTCNGVPTRTGSTTSNSITIGSLEAGIQYSVSVTGRNNLAELESTGTTTLNTTETGKTSLDYVVFNLLFFFICLFGSFFSLCFCLSVNMLVLVSFLSFYVSVNSSVHLTIS